MASKSVQADRRPLYSRLKVRLELEQSWWIYPIARFFGHALYEYRYDLDFSECTAAINQERNLILYKSYCNLLGSLVAKRVLDCGHGTKPQDVIMEIIKFAYKYSDFDREAILNLFRAALGVHQFGCVIMRYCTYFKLLCLEDMKTCITSTDLKLHTFWKQMMDSLSHFIFVKDDVDYRKETRKARELCEHFNLQPSLISIPYICEIGIKLNSGPEYDNLMKDIHTEFTIANSHKTATEYAESAEVKGKEVLMNKEKASEDKGIIPDPTKSIKMESKPEFKASEDKNKRSGDKDTTPVDLTKSVKIESKPEFDASEDKNKQSGHKNTTPVDLTKSVKIESKPEFEASEDKNKQSRDKNTTPVDLAKSVKMESKPEFEASEDKNKQSGDKDTTPVDLSKSVKSKPEFKASEDKNRQSGDKDTTSDVLTKPRPVKDTKMESKPELLYILPLHEDIKHGEIQTTEKTTSSSLSPYEAIQRVLDKYKSANEPIPTDLLTNLSYLKIKDPYSEFERINLTVVGHSLPSIAQSKSTKASSAPLTSQSKPTKSWSPPSASRSKTSKSLSPPSASQSSVGVTSHAAVTLSAPKPKERSFTPKSKTSKGLSPPSALQPSVRVTSHAEVTLSVPKPKERSFTPKLTFSSGLFSSNAAERNRIIADLPNSDSSREKYILNEYDCRMKKHIAFQAATFELLNAKKGLHEVSNLIHQQRKFEEKWPSRYSKTTSSEEFYDENIFNTNIEVREIDMTEMIKESQEAVKLLRHLLNSFDSVKQMVAK